MVTTAALLFRHGHEVCGVFLLLHIVLLMIAGFCTFFSLTHMDALLPRMVGFVGLSAIAFDVCRAFLALEAAVLTLGHWAAFLGHQGEFAVWRKGQARARVTGRKVRTRVVTTTHAMTFQARLTFSPSVLCGAVRDYGAD
jgi:hypothetical protein